MSEVKRAGDALKDVKRIRGRIGAAGDRLMDKIASLDAAASKIEQHADQCETEEKELTALLAEVGSNFPDDEEAAPPKKKGILGI
jgi:peptidoglycan hydrolase CwlO-like protein